MDTTETTQEAEECYCGKQGCHYMQQHARAVEDGETGAARPMLMVELPPPVADFGPVRLELMGHRYREGHLSEVVIAGQPFLRLYLASGSCEYYRPDAVYCITPGLTPTPVPHAEIPARFGWADRDPDEDLDDSEDPF